ncbi:DUF1036 domain-containing protein [Blastochloris viridis]|uniref:DUF1036 domain-containing protein n=1 Tax=Blastochloris viridis TaxID=1079 RepID=A0A182D0S5_BLAVI|nr:DUF1036 domain-containing protein [Blastochloris viridis]BAR98392.1 hypothetical protein BV133_799 [Blastochloris viridis]
MSALAAASPAAADLTVCNRTSFVLDAAIGLEAAGATATRGWFRFEPGQCRPVLSGDMPGGQLLLHARALAIYGRDAFSQDGHRELCVEDGDFLIAAATSCTAPARPARFAVVVPKATAQGPTAALTEDADFSIDAARRAGVQRLLAVAGYDPGPIDGLPGRRTDQALARLVAARRLPADTARGPAVFERLVAAAEAAGGRGLTWCNDTRHAVMAALGEDDHGAIVSRGWWRVEPGRCVAPDALGPAPRRLFSFAEAVGPDGAVVTEGGRALAWGGPTLLCTRASRFELRDHADCAGRGLDVRGFAAVELAGQRGRTVWFGTRSAPPHALGRD